MVVTLLVFNYFKSFRKDKFYFSFFFKIRKKRKISLIKLQIPRRSNGLHPPPFTILHICKLSFNRSFFLSFFDFYLFQNSVFPYYTCQNHKISRKHGLAVKIVVRAACALQGDQLVHEYLCPTPVPGGQGTLARLSVRPSRRQKDRPLSAPQCVAGI